MKRALLALALALTVAAVPATAAESPYFRWGFGEAPRKAAVPAQPALVYTAHPFTQTGTGGTLVVDALLLNVDTSYKVVAVSLPSNNFQILPCCGNQVRIVGATSVPLSGDVVLAITGEGRTETVRVPYSLTP